MHWQNLRIESEKHGQLRAVIEATKGSFTKLAVDHAKGFLELSDVLLGPMPWPCHYGFYPQTIGTDDDPIDVLLVASFDLPPLTVVDTRLVGAVDVDYPEKGLERRLIAVCPADPVFGTAHELDQLAAEKREEIRLFYETYVTNDKRDLRVEKFVGRTAARDALDKAREKYRSRQRAA